MGLLEGLKALARLIPYKREEFKQEFEIRLADSPPCHQREIKQRHRWAVWHTQTYISHVTETGQVTLRQVQ